MKKILIIEDNLINMQLESDILIHDGYKVIKAFNAGEAFKLLENDTPDLILLDIQLPGMNGYEFFDKLKSDEKYKNVKVVVVTAQATLDNKKEIRKYSFDDVLYKPIMLNKFRDTVKKLIDT